MSTAPLFIKAATTRPAAPAAAAAVTAVPALL